MCYNTNTKQIKALLCLCFALVSYPTQTCGEMQFFQVTAEAGTVHYSGEYLENPGSVDLSRLVFWLTGEGYNYVDENESDDEFTNEDDFVTDNNDDFADTVDDTTDEEFHEHSDTSQPTKIIPFDSTKSPVAPTNSPVDPTDFPTNSPVDPTDFPTNSPVAPTNSPVAPTNSPVAPTNSPVVSTNSLVTAEPVIDDDTSESFVGLSNSSSSEDGILDSFNPDNSTLDPFPSPLVTEPIAATQEPSSGLGTDRLDPFPSPLVTEPIAATQEPSSGLGTFESTPTGTYEPTPSVLEPQDAYDYDGADGYNDDTEDYDDDYARQLEGIIPGSYIDILFFKEPSDCVNTKAGCNWTDLGIGISDSYGDRYCCTEDDASRGIKCETGRMIVDPDKFQGENRVGEHRVVLVPLSGEIVQAEDPFLETRNGSGKYTMAIALCSNIGGRVLIGGQVTWKSKHGLLPAELFDEYCFSVFVTVVYFILMVWYAMSMWKHRDASIGIQVWILVTIILGLLVMVLKVTDFTLWNLNGIRQQDVVYAWISFGGLEGSISRCLLVMVSLGWGVVRDTIGDQMKQIVLAGLVYASLSFAVEAATIYLEKDVKDMEENQENESPIKLVLSFAVAIMELVFYIWILDALNGTMQYLENMNQSLKLKRYLRLRLILLISILFAMVVIVYTLVNNNFEGSVLGDGQEWATAAAWDANYMFILIGVAILWRPNPNAKQFAYVIELPTTGGGGDLTFDTRIDSVDEDGQGDHISYRDVQNDHFKIDDAEPS